MSSFLRWVRLAGICAALFGIADFAFSWNPLAAGPYLANRELPVFRPEPYLGGGVVAEAFNGWIAALAFAFIEPALKGSPWRRGLSFGLVLWGFWVVSGTFSAWVWLSVPTSLAVANVAFGLPKCVAIGVGTAWAWRRWAPRP